MARPRTQVGTSGNVSLTPFRWDADLGRWVALPAADRAAVRRAERWRARAKFRDMDGKLRDVERWAPRKTAAEQALLAAMSHRTAPTDAKAGGLRPGSTIQDTSQVWLREIDERDLAQGTRDLYRYAVTNYINPLMGGLTVSEVKPPNVDHLLRTVRDEHGPGSAKTARAVLSGMLGVAVRHGAIPVNPVRNAAKLPTKVSKRSAHRGDHPRALTVEQRDALLAKLAVSEVAHTYDTADLIEFMLRTGCRIGETIAVRWQDIDLDAATVSIGATIRRVPGEGLEIQPRPKSAAGRRLLPLSPPAVAMLRARLEAGKIGPQGVVFPSPRGNLRDPSNTAGDLRHVLDQAGLEWVTSHTFRKTVATLMDEAGLSARQVADQLGHARPSLTQDVYMGRKLASTAAADVL